MTVLLQVLAESGVDTTLDALMKSSEPSFERTQLENMFLDNGAVSPSDLFDRLLHSNVLQSIGERFGLSANGRRLSLLLAAINGADIHDTYLRIRRIDGIAAAYELVRQGMTRLFFESLVDSPGFGTLYVCSPWINPSERDIAKLKYAVLKQEERRGALPEILVITRPPDDRPKGAEDGLQPFRDVGAKVYYNKKVHSKLYIREPDVGGGTLLAIVGSENLTRSNYLELGIQISGDDQIINQLIKHFLELTNISEEE